MTSSNLGCEKCSTWAAKFVVRALKLAKLGFKFGEACLRESFRQHPRRAGGCRGVRQLLVRISRGRDGKLRFGMNPARSHLRVRSFRSTFSGGAIIIDAPMPNDSVTIGSVGISSAQATRQSSSKTVSSTATHDAARLSKSRYNRQAARPNCAICSDIVEVELTDFKGDPSQPQTGFHFVEQTDAAPGRRSNRKLWLTNNKRGE